MFGAPLRSSPGKPQGLGNQSWLQGCCPMSEERDGATGPGGGGRSPHIHGQPPPEEQAVRGRSTDTFLHLNSASFVVVGSKASCRSNAQPPEPPSMGVAAWLGSSRSLAELLASLLTKQCCAHSEEEIPSVCAEKTAAPTAPSSQLGHLASLPIKKLLLPCLSSPSYISCPTSPPAR